MWRPAVEDGPPDEDDLHIMEPWYIELDTPATRLPEENPSPLEFLYRHYGFLEIAPTSPPKNVLSFDAPAVCRIVGLEPKGSNHPEHLNSFISSIMQSRCPSGHCDLSLTAPPNEQFLSSVKADVRNTVFQSSIPDLSEDPLLLFVNTTSDPLLVAHEALGVLGMVRAGTQLQLRAELQYLLHNGSRFTLLYPQTRPSAPPSFDILTFPLYGKESTPGKKDFGVYMSRLKAFFHERPNVVAAAFSRGGIA